MNWLYQDAGGGQGREGMLPNSANMTVAELKPNRPLITNILVLTDFSDCSRQALGHAVLLARRYRATITLLHVILPGHWPIKNAEKPRTTLKRLEAGLAQKGLFTAIPHSLLVKQGSAWSVVSQVLTQRKIDLIVTGTHGRPGWEMIWMGSFAETVFRRARCPVLTVGPRNRPPEPDAALKSVLFATDFSDESEAAEPYAFALASANGAKLILLHVLKPGRTTPAEQMKKRLDDAKAKLRATMLHLAAERSGSIPDLKVEVGRPAETILKMAERIEADLVVLGATAPRRLADRLGSTTAYRVVCQAPCPVLTIREPSLIDYFQHLFAVMPKINSASDGRIRSRSSIAYAWWDPFLKIKNQRQKS
jgi:nucleotide-binding universal stress UspA family protein